jgi:hypothetical protein
VVAVVGASDALGDINYATIPSGLVTSDALLTTLLQHVARHVVALRAKSSASYEADLDALVPDVGLCVRVEYDDVALAESVSEALAREADSLGWGGTSFAGLREHVTIGRLIPAGKRVRESRTDRVR